MMARPESERLVYVSWKTTAENAMATTMDSLSMGTTTETIPSWMA